MFDREIECGIPVVNSSVEHGISIFSSSVEHFSSKYSNFEKINELEKYTSHLSSDIALR